MLTLELEAKDAFSPMQGYRGPKVVVGPWPTYVLIAEARDQVIEKATAIGACRVKRHVSQYAVDLGCRYKNEGVPHGFPDEMAQVWLLNYNELFNQLRLRMLIAQHQKTVRLILSSGKSVTGRLSGISSSNEAAWFSEGMTVQRRDGRPFMVKTDWAVKGRPHQQHVSINKITAIAAL